MKESQYIWMDGEFVAWKDAKVHVLTHTLHYGNGVFEGTRAYQTHKGLAIFRLACHTKRLLNSSKIVAIDCPFNQEQLESAQIELLRKNHFDGNVYLRPIIFLGYGAMGVYHKNSPVNVAIAAWEWGAYLGDEGLQKGIRVKTSSFVRNPVKSFFGKAKVIGGYVNSQMAKYEAIACGFDEALLLDDSGFVAEGSGECIFIVRNGKLITPPHDNSLESITQATIVEIARKLGIVIEERRITRDEIYIADEAFFTGTAAEVTPIAELDFRPIGKGTRGELTKKLQDAYFDVVLAKNKDFEHYLTFVK